MSDALDPKGEWLLRVLGVDLAAASIVADPAAFDPNLAERLGDARASLAMLAKAGDPAAGAIQSLLLAAHEATEAGASDAPDRMLRVEEALAQAMSAARVREAGSASVIGVKFRQLLIDWHRAQGQVQDNLTALGESFLDLEEVRGDPRFDDVVEAVDMMFTLIPSFGSKLDDDINALLNSGGKDAGLVGSARKTLKQYRQQLAAAPQLKALEAFGSADVGGDYPLYSALTGAMDQMDQALDQAA